VASYFASYTILTKITNHWRNENEQQKKIV
jgi:hypothetical protein